jgi:hypothetical protein
VAGRRASTQEATDLGLTSSRRVRFCLQRFLEREPGRDELIPRPVTPRVRVQGGGAYIGAVTGLDVAGLHGGAYVEAAPAGGSFVLAEVNAPGAVTDEGRLRDVLAATMRHLRRDVSDNFNAG